MYCVSLFRNFDVPASPLPVDVAGASGDVSVLAMEKLTQALRQKEEEVAHLQQRITDVSHLSFG
jgi:hypothetical protein